MGMFDWVAFEMGCPKCCAPVSGFQTKDKGCNLRVLLPWTVNEFYSTCPECGAHIEFRDGEQIQPMYDTGVEMLPYPPNGCEGA